MMFAREFRIERSTTIHAAPERILRLVDSPYMWHAWSAADRRQPMAERTYSGARRGRGAVVSWDGGRMEILDASPATVRVALDAGLAEFRFEPSGEATKVTWSMKGQRAPFSGAHQTLGNDFEEGLQNLKAIAEK